jgi:hypothetical protein
MIVCIYFRFSTVYKKKHFIHFYHSNAEPKCTITITVFKKHSSIVHFANKESPA